MKLNQYPKSKLKDSGIEWIGEVPEGWEVKRLKFCARICNGQDQKEVLDENGSYPILGTGGEFGKSTEYLYNKPSVLLGRKGTIDKPIYIDVPFWTVDTLFYTKINKKTHPKFFYYLATQINFKYYSDTTAVPSMTQEKLNEAPLSNPPLPEQIQISVYLDTKTSEIDSLIQKDKRLIELLKEKRIALINHVVTKGLNPKAKLKDSEIEWIGKVPDGWEVKKLKFCTILNRKSLDENTNPNIQINYLDISNVDSNGNVLNYEELFMENAPSRARRIPKKGDTILSTVRTYLKSIAYLNEIPRNTIVSTGFAVIEPLKELNSKYLFYAVRSEVFIQSVIAESTGVAYPAINPSELNQISVLLPSISEQIQIASYLDKKTSKIDQTIEKIEKKIELLEEYKKSLIHHVVTGKVDVTEVAT